MRAHEEVCKECKNTNGEHLSYCSRFVNEDEVEVEVDSRTIEDEWWAKNQRAAEALGRISTFLDDIAIIYDMASSYPREQARAEEATQNYARFLKQTVRHGEQMTANLLLGIMSGAIRPVSSLKPNEK